MSVGGITNWKPACQEALLDPQYFEMDYDVTPKHNITPKENSLLKALVEGKLTTDESWDYEGQKLKIIATNYLTPSEDLKLVAKKCNEVAANEICLWIHTVADGQTKYEYFVGSNAVWNDTEESFFKDWLLSIKPITVSFNPLKAVLQGIADLTKNLLIIPPKYWDCDDANYVQLPWVSDPSDCSDACITENDWAFLCGAWDGVVGEVSGIFEFFGLLSDSQGRTDLWTGIKSLTRSESWSKIIDNIRQQHIVSGCKLQHQIGIDVLQVASFVLPITKISKAKMIATVGNLADNVVLTLSKFKSVANGAYRVANNVANGVIKISQVSGKLVTDIADEFCWAANQTVNAFGKSGVLQTTDGINYTLNLGDRILLAKEIAQDASGRIIATIKDGTEEVMVVIKGAYKTLDDIWRLHPNLKTLYDNLPTHAQNNLEKLNPNTLKTLLQRLESNTELLSAVKQKPELTRLWTAHKEPAFTATEIAEAENAYLKLADELSEDARKLAEDLAEESNKKALMLSIFGAATTFESGVALNAFKAKTGATQVVTHVTLEVDGVAIRVDYLGYNPTTRMYHLGEAKFSTLDINWSSDWLSAATDNQVIVLPKVQTETVVEYIVKATDADKIRTLAGIGLGNNSKIAFGNTTFNLFGSQANQQVVKTIVTLK